MWHELISILLSDAGSAATPGEISSEVPAMCMGIVFPHGRNIYIDKHTFWGKPLVFSESGWLVPCSITRTIPEDKVPEKKFGTLLFAAAQASASFTGEQVIVKSEPDTRAFA